MFERSVLGTGLLALLSSCMSLEDYPKVDETKPLLVHYRDRSSTVIPPNGEEIDAPMRRTDILYRVTDTVGRDITFFDLHGDGAHDFAVVDGKYTAIHGTAPLSSYLRNMFFSLDSLRKRGSEKLVDSRTIAPRTWPTYSPLKN